MSEIRCVRSSGHEWQLLTRHPDPPWVRPGVLPNAICVHCSEQTWIDVQDEQPALPSLED